MNRLKFESPQKLERHRRFLELLNINGAYSNKLCTEAGIGQMPLHIVKPFIGVIPDDDNARRLILAKRDYYRKHPSRCSEIQESEPGGEPQPGTPANGDIIVINHMIKKLEEAGYQVRSTTGSKDEFGAEACIHFIKSIGYRIFQPVEI